MNIKLFNKITYYDEKHAFNSVTNMLNFYGGGIDVASVENSFFSVGQPLRISSNNAVIEYNYMRVVDNGNMVYWCFIDDIQRVAETVYDIYYSVDEWNTYFNFTAGNEIAQPIIGGLVKRLPYDSFTRLLNQPPIINDYKLVKPKFQYYGVESSSFYIVAVTANNTGIDQKVFIPTDENRGFTYEELVLTVEKLSSLAKIDGVPHDLLGLYAVPVYLYEDTGFQEDYRFSVTIEIANGETFTIWQDSDPSEIIEKTYKLNETAFSVLPNKKNAFRVYCGTPNNRQLMPYVDQRNSDFYVRIRFSDFGAFNIIMEMDGATFDITEEFACPIVANQKMVDIAQYRSRYNIEKLISFGGGIGATLGAVINPSPVGLLGGIGGLYTAARSVYSVYEDASKPASIQTNGNFFKNYATYSGIICYSVVFENSAENVSATVDEFGVKTALYVDSIRNEYSKYDGGYWEMQDIKITPIGAVKIPFSALSYIQNVFENGVKIKVV